ncbi:ankyrin repeat domain-containing protein [Wolbachia endosymbiont of Mansonella perstans]|uniref:ankyrin repeat domain-containing protein n=1 Tax=Wolbachia endosymbiont of Mansonella perstans TaxID=229526 RepID=UPI0034CF9A68
MYLKKLSSSFNIWQIPDKEGNTVLHYAEKSSNHGLVRLFINKCEIDMNLKDQYGQTPLVFIMGNFVPGVDNNENLSITEYFNRRFSHGNAC